MSMLLNSVNMCENKPGTSEESSLLEDDKRPDEGIVLNKPIVNSLIVFLYYLKYDSNSKLFSYSSSKFRSVAICGIVKEIRNASTHEKMYLIVDDGTAWIKVFGDNLPEELEKEKDAVNSELEKTLFPCYRDFSLHHMSYVFNWNSARIAQCRPNMKEIKLGDLVYLHGNLCEYRNGRQIFLKYLRKIPTNRTEFRHEWLYQCLERFRK